jgi:hypothetical protein
LGRSADSNRRWVLGFCRGSGGVSRCTGPVRASGCCRRDLDPGTIKFLAVAPGIVETYPRCGEFATREVIGVSVVLPHRRIGSQRVATPRCNVGVGSDRESIFGPLDRDLCHVGQKRLPTGFAQWKTSLTLSRFRSIFHAKCPQKHTRAKRERGFSRPLGKALPTPSMHIVARQAFILALFSPFERSRRWIRNSLTR